mgnify:CR=1 FL=1
MNIFSFSYRLLFSSKRFSYTNISIYLSLASFMLAISVSLLVIGVSRGYKKNIEMEISNIEPDVVISSHSGSLISADDINSYIEANKNNFSDTTVSSKYFESYAMIKKKNTSKGVLLYAMDKKNINDIFNFKSLDILSNNDDFVYISKDIKNEFSLTDDMELYFFNIEEMLKDQKIMGIKGKVTGIYESNIKTFDDNIVFVSFSIAENLFKSKNIYSGIMIENYNEERVELLNGNLKLHAKTWQTKHENLLNWLTIFSNPIKLILLFILLLALIYKLFTFWLILYDKTDAISRLKMLGLANSYIYNISYNIIIMLTFVSIFFGSLLALLLSKLQNKYQIIAIDPNIYILSKIDSILFYSDIVYLSISSLIILLFSARLITHRKLKKINI